MGGMVSLDSLVASAVCQYGTNPDFKAHVDNLLAQLRGWVEAYQLEALLRMRVELSSGLETTVVEQVFKTYALAATED